MRRRLTTRCVAERIAALLLALMLAGPALAHGSEDEEEEACRRGAEAVMTLAGALPAGDPSRRFAEADANTALTEMGAGEVDECPELLARAHEVLETRPYRLRPGERMMDYRPELAD